MIFWGLILTTLESSSFFGGSWDSFENWLEYKIKPPPGKFSLPKPVNALWQVCVNWGINGRIFVNVMKYGKLCLLFLACKICGKKTGEFLLTKIVTKKMPVQVLQCLKLILVMLAVKWILAERIGLTAWC